MIIDADMKAALMPRAGDDGFDMGYVYLVEFSTGVVKVGRSSSVRRRLRTYYEWAEALQQRVMFAWWSDQVPRHKECEMRILEWAKANATKRVRSEWFWGLGLSDAVGQAASVAPTAPGLRPLVKVLHESPGMARIAFAAARMDEWPPEGLTDRAAA